MAILLKPTYYNIVPKTKYVSLLEFLKDYPYNIHPYFCRWCAIIRSNGAGTVRSITKQMKNLENFRQWKNELFANRL